MSRWASYSEWSSIWSTRIFSESLRSKPIRSIESSTLQLLQSRLSRATGIVWESRSIRFLEKLMRFSDPNFAASASKCRIIRRYQHFTPTRRASHFMALFTQSWSSGVNLLRYNRKVSSRLRCRSGAKHTRGRTSTAPFTISLLESFGWSNTEQWRSSIIKPVTKPFCNSNRLVQSIRIFIALRERYRIKSKLRNAWECLYQFMMNQGKKKIHFVKLFCLIN